MLSPYRSIFALPGALKFSLAGLIARLPIAILGLGLVLFVQALTGSYGIAGAVSAVYLGAQAVVNPVLARLVDRLGQARVMVPATIVHVTALGLLLSAAYLGLWFGLVFIFAAIAGASVGSVGALVRARWTYVTHTQKQLNTAFSWEAVADEILFVTGPVLVTFAATAVFAPAGIIASVIGVSVGALLFYPQKATEPPVHAKEAAAPKTKLLTNSAILVVILCNFFIGVNFGAIDVAVIAFSDEQGYKSLAGAGLGVFAVGSLLAGMVYGALTWNVAVRYRFAAALACLAAGSWLLQLSTNMVTLSLLLFILGSTVAPSLIAGSAIMQELAPPTRLTEAFAWSGTAMAFGVALGSAGTGSVVDAADAHTAFLIPAAGASAAALLAIVSLQWLDPAARSRAVQAETQEARTVVNTVDEPADSAVPPSVTEDGQTDDAVPQSGTDTVVSAADDAEATEA